MFRVLIVDDERSICEVLSVVLQEKGYEVSAAASGREGIDVARAFAPDVVLLDMNLPDVSGIEVLEAVRRQQPDCAVIIMTAFGTIRNAVQTTRLGAYDYLEKPVDNDALVLLVERAIEVKRLSSEVDQLRSELSERYRFENIVGISGAMSAVFQLMDRFARVDGTVLITGESGTGKELVARAIHFNSPRCERPFVTVNCGAIPKDLIESEFFGHTRGAFTDAKSDRIGKFEQANGGTIFLDEIGELPAEAQVKFLRVLGEREVTKIGGMRALPVDVRVIAATNKNLTEEISKGVFREDLYWRLAVLSVHLPPLRERLDDIPPLVEHFCRKHSAALKKGVIGVEGAAMKLLQSYDWPGNVRELESAIYEALVFCEDDRISSPCLPRRLLDRAAPPPQAKVLESSLQTSTDEAEKRAIEQALRLNNYSKTRTAEQLGISRKTLFNKMKKLNIGL